MSPFAFLTPDWLARNTQDASLERGRSYYQRGRILSVRLHGQVVEGKVQGSQRYTQTLGIDEAGQPVAQCTCLFNQGGLCKHIVAVAMAVLDGHYSRVSAEQPETEASGSGKDFFRELFRTSPQGMQDGFLIQLFVKHPEWRAAFLRYSRPLPAQHLVDIGQIRDSLRESLRAPGISWSDLEELQQHIRQPQEAAENLLRKTLYELFKPHRDHLKRRVGMNDWINAHRIWVATYEAMSGLLEPQELDLVFPDEYSSYLRWEWLQLNEDLLGAIAREMVGPALVREVVGLVSDRWSYYASGQDQRKPAIVFDIRDMEPWLMLLSSDPVSETFIRQRKEAYGWALTRWEEEYGA